MAAASCSWAPAALSNTPLARALADARGERVAGSRESLRRYRALARRAAEYGVRGPAVDYVFAALESVAQRPGGWLRLLGALLGHPQPATVWQTVFVPAQRRIELTTAADRRRKTLSLSALDLDAAAPVRLWDLGARAGGDLAPRMAPYARSANEALIRRVYRHFSKQVPPADQRRIAAFPDDFYTFAGPGNPTPAA